MGGDRGYERGLHRMNLIYPTRELAISFPSSSEFDPFQIFFEEGSCSIETFSLEDESISSLLDCPVTK
jgi:hypothetical protein